MARVLHTVSRFFGAFSSKGLVLLAITGFALVGTIVLQFTKAATDGVAVEAENGNLVALQPLSDPDASNNTYVQFEPTPAVTPQPTMIPGQIPLDQLPKGIAGSGQALIQGGAPAGAPTATWASAFRIECGYSHMNYDDPIVYPNQQGRAHLHTYFGNTAVNYASTYESIRATGNSTCSGGILNRSAYWVPTMMNGATPIAPSRITTYYKSGWPSVPFATLKNIPTGLKMITGDHTASSNQNPIFRVFIEWHCVSGSSGASYTIPVCNAGDEVQLIIGFPQCWDGVNLDSPNHKSHMAMPNSWSGPGCPTTHPVPIPHIEFLVYWPVTSGTSSGWRLSSDMYSTSIPGGYSAHADYMEGWDPTIRDLFTQQCLVVGKDCQVRWLGDGRTLVDPAGIGR
jgi:hypothetical protein